MKQDRDAITTGLPSTGPAAPTDVWFVAYDICNPKRLQRVHRCVRRQGVALQYSGFAVTGDSDRLLDLLETLADIIDDRADDVRAYHLPTRCQVWALGRQSWPGDITLTGHGALEQLLTAADVAAATTAREDDAVEHGTMSDDAVLTSKTASRP